MDNISKKSRSENFELLEGFPPKQITEMDKTIEDLKIMESMLTQRVN